MVPHLRRYFDHAAFSVGLDSSDGSDADEKNASALAVVGESDWATAEEAANWAKDGSRFGQSRCA